MRLRHPQPDPSISTKTYRRIISGRAPPASGTSHPGSADQLKDGQRSSKHSNPEEESDGGAENGSNRGDENVSCAREERTMTATSTASGRVTIMRESIAAMSPSPHQDDRLLKIPK